MIDGFSIKVMVAFSSIFNEEARNLDAYLGGIKRSDLLYATSFFLSFSNNNEQITDYKKFLEMFFCTENKGIADEIYSKLNELKTKEKAELIIINSLTSLQLFEYCFNNMKEDNSQTKAETELNIFKAILIINERNIGQQDLAFESTNSICPELKLASLTFTQLFAYSDIINYNKSEVAVGQIIKSIYLFEFLETNPKTRSLLDKFLESYRCVDWKEYLKSILSLAFSVIKSDREGTIDITVERDENFKNNCELIDNLTVTDSEVIEGYDFIRLRSAPFYKIEEGLYRIIYGLFLIEFLHRGIYFKLSEINKTLDEKDKVIGDFRGFYCDEYSERFLLYKILNNIYRNKYVEFNGSEMKAHNIEAEPDYYIRKNNSVFLFESKDILINATIKLTYDYAQYEPELKKKLYFEDKGGKIENKAVLQLINNTERLIQNQFDIDTKYKSHLIYIYPIIILHNRQLNVPGLNVLVNNWFNDELQKLKTKGLKTDRVQSVTIIDIDTLIYYQDLFIDRILKFENVLDDYFKFITLKRNKKYASEEHAIQYAKRTLISFSTFLSNYVSERKISKPPKMLLEKGITLFK